MAKKRLKAETDTRNNVATLDAPSAPAPADATGGAELLDVEEAMARLKTTRPTFYRWLRTGKLKGIKIGRQWRFYKKDIESFLKGEEPQPELPADIRPLIEQLQRRTNKKGAAIPEANAINAVNLMIQAAIEMRASDLHLEPLTKPDGRTAIGQVRVRVDGSLHTMAEFDGRLQRPLVERWKTMCGCDVHERQRPQDGRIACTVQDKSFDLRVGFLPALFGETVTARILSAEGLSFDLDRFDFAPRDKERITRALACPWGMVLCTGPTGSGKSTLLYSCLMRLLKPTVKVVTVENPVEVAIPGVTQLQVNPVIDASFAYLLRAVLRNDPDVILIGELRDSDTLAMGLESALTGHLVLTTLHTDEAASALIRMVEMTGESFLISEAVKLIVAQRLIRKLCPDCSQPAAHSEAQMQQAASIARVGGLGELPGRKFRKPVGCANCKQTGFRGRTVVAETLCLSNEIVTALRRGTSAGEIRTLAIGQGMVTLAADAVRRASLGQVYLEEALRYAPA